MMFDLVDKRDEMQYRQNDFDDSVLRTFRAGLAGVEFYALANSLSLDRTIELSQNFGHETAAKLFWRRESARESNRQGRVWYRLTWISSAITDMPEHMPSIWSFSDEPAHSVLQLDLGLNQSGSLVLCLPEIFSLKKSGADMQHIQAIGPGKFLAYRFEQLSQTHPTAHLLFDLSRQSWNEYRRLYCLLTEPRLSEHCHSEIQAALCNYYRCLGPGFAQAQSASAFDLLQVPMSFQYSSVSDKVKVDSAAVFKHKRVLSGNSPRLNIEECFRIDHLLIVQGWVYNPESSELALMISDTEGHNLINLTELVCRLKRVDVEQAFAVPSRLGLQKAFGFAVCADLRSSPLLLQQEMTFHCVRDTEIDSIPITVNAEIPADLDAVHKVIGALGSHTVSRSTCRSLLEPVFRTVAHCLCTHEIEPQCTWFQSQSAGKASVSIIVPLFGQVRFEIAQIASLAALRFPGVEVLFAVDDPSIYSDVLSNVKRQSALYGLRCAVVYPGTNLGFSGINNFASSYATSDALLFLNSDCFLTKPATLFKAMSWVQAPDAGAIGFRLLYPGGAIQHDGMSNDLWKDDPDFIVNLHPRNGEKPQKFSPGLDSNVSLLTAACLLMRKQVFQKIGGFNRVYLRGDFEDSDLCLKLIISGYRLGLLQTNDIYHLERQSISQQEPSARQVITLANSHLYAQRWEHVIQAGLPALELVQ